MAQEPQTLPSVTSAGISVKQQGNAIASALGGGRKKKQRVEEADDTPESKTTLGNLYEQMDDDDADTVGDDGSAFQRPVILSSEPEAIYEHQSGASLAARALKKMR